MIAYEVFVRVPYLDQDYNTCYHRKNGVFFKKRNDAKEYMLRMVEDKKTNEKLEPITEEEANRCWITIDDYVGTKITWEKFCCLAYRKTLSEEKQEYLEKVFERNRLVQDMCDYQAAYLAVTYGGNRWYLREIIINE